MKHSWQVWIADPNTGLSPVDWGAWEEEWRSVDITTRELSRETTNSEVTNDSGWRRGFTQGGPTSASNA